MTDFGVQTGDRLPALTGVAQMIENFAKKSLGQYLAGLWEEELLYQLSWQAELIEIPSSQARGTPSPNYAISSKGKEKMQSTLVGSATDKANYLRKPTMPSWSWISTLYPVKWEASRIAPKVDEWEDLHSAKVLDASCTYDSTNKFGQVSSGRLVLEADLVSTTIENIGAASESTLSLKLKTSSMFSDALFLPDTPDLGLSVGDSIQCALLYRYQKDGRNIWTALGLRRVVDNVAEDSGQVGPKFVSHQAMVVRAAENWRRALLTGPSRLRESEAYRQSAMIELASPKERDLMLPALISCLQSTSVSLQSSLKLVEKFGFIREDFCRTRLSDIISCQLPLTLKEQLAQAERRYRDYKDNGWK
jgi:hypothetical protein